MKFLYLLLFLTFLSCGTSKKDSSDKNNTDPKVESDAKTTLNKSTTIDKGIVDPKQDLIIVPKNANQIIETREFIQNSGLVWDKMLLDQESLKVGLIRVPADKKDFWIDKLIKSGGFRHIKLYSEDALKKLIEKEKNTFLTMRKASCLGDCPVYEVTISKKGKLTFNGIKYTPLKGEHEFQLNDKEFNTLKSKIKEKKFTEYKSKYDNPKIKDLPSTFITYNGKQVQVRLWKKAPNELVNIHEFLESLLLSKKCIQ